MSINTEKFDAPKNLNIKTNSNANTINVRHANNSLPIELDELGTGQNPYQDKNMGLDYLTNQEQPESESDQSEENVDPLMDERFTYSENHHSSDTKQPELSYEDIQQRKAFALYNLKRYSDQGYVLSRKFGLMHELDEIELEVLRIEKERDMDNGLVNCKSLLTAFTHSVETINTNYGPNWIKLNGWSKFVIEEHKSHKYDDCLIKLYQKYSSKLPDSPELTLIFLLGASAYTFHMTRLSAEHDYAKQNQKQPYYGTQPYSEPPSMKEPSSYEDIMTEIDNSDTNSVTSAISARSSISQSSRISGVSGVSDTSDNSQNNLSITIPDLAPKPAPKKRGRPRKVKL